MMIIYEFKLLVRYIEIVSKFIENLYDFYDIHIRFMISVYVLDDKYR